MENEIKVNEYVRLKTGEIFKVDENCATYLNYDLNERKRVKHSPNLKDLIRVKDIIRIHNLKGDDIEFWFEIFDDKTMMDFKLGLDDKEIEVLEVVTKEMMESISYKVERKD